MALQYLQLQAETSATYSFDGLLGVLLSTVSPEGEAATKSSTSTIFLMLVMCTCEFFINICFFSSIACSPRTCMYVCSTTSTKGRKRLNRKTVSTKLQNLSFGNLSRNSVSQIS